MEWYAHSQPLMSLFVNLGKSYLQISLFSPFSSLSFSTISSPNTTNNSLLRVSRYIPTYHYTNTFQSQQNDHTNPKPTNDTAEFSARRFRDRVVNLHHPTLPYPPRLLLHHIRICGRARTCRCCLYHGSKACTYTPTRLRYRCRFGCWSKVEVCAFDCNLE